VTADELNALLEKHEMSGAELARRLGTIRRNVVFWTTGARPIPPRRVPQILAALAGRAVPLKLSVAERRELVALLDMIAWGTGGNKTAARLRDKVRSSLPARASDK